MRCYFWVLAVLLTGCATVDDGTLNDNQQELSVSALVLDVEARPSVLGRGDTLYIRLTVTNESDAPAVKHFASGCILGFSLWNLQGELVAPPPPICTLNAPTVKYAPGEVVIAEWQWVWDDPNIEPGTYLLVAGFGPRGEHESAPSIEIRLQ